MRKTTVAVLCLVFAFSGVVLAENPPVGGIDEPFHNSCSTCTYNLWVDEGVCNASPAGDWADCTGGKICYNDPLAGTQCYPYCGRTRCYYI